MSVVKRIIKNNIEQVSVDELLAKEYEHAGYGGIQLTKTPMGAQINLFAMRPGRVIGKRGRTIKAASAKLEDHLGLQNPQITVIEVEVPELNPQIMAARVANALERGVHFRRAIFWSLRRIMDSGALGCEILLKGPLRSARSRFEKVVEGYVPKSGEPALRNVKTATFHVKMKRGTLGVTVSIVPPDAEFPDKISLDGLPEIEYQLPMEEPVAETAPTEAVEPVEGETIEAAQPETEAAEPVITDEAAPVEEAVEEIADEVTEAEVEVAAEAVQEPAVEPVVEESTPESAVEEPATEEVSETVEESAVEEAPEVVEVPAVEEPLAEESVVEESTEEAVVVEKPVEEPVVEEPVVEESAAEEAVAEEPAVEEPVVEESATEELVEATPEEPAPEPELVSESEPEQEPEVEEVESEPEVKPMPEADKAEEPKEDQSEEEQ